MDGIKRMNFNFAPRLIASLINSIDNVDKNGLDLQPSYQRGYIWNKEFKEKLIYSIAIAYPIGNIIIRNLETPNEKGAKSEVVDGQQRLTTIYNFINNSLILESETSYEIIKANLAYYEEEEDSEIKKILKKYKEGKKNKLTFKNLPKKVQNNISSFELGVTTISNAEKGQVEEYFRFVQNQERLRAGEIIQSFPDTALEKYLQDLDEQEELLKILGFEDNRKEFEKVFYSMVGVFNKSINFGTTDKEIIKFVTEKGDTVGEDAIKLTKSMVRNLNLIKRFGKTKIKSNKRLLKYILLICGFDLLEFSEKNTDKILKELEIINDKLSVFNSAKKDIIKKAFGNDEIKIEIYRQLALLTKGSHVFKKVKEETENLANEVKKVL